MKFSKIRDVKSPQRGTELSAGIDFFVPKFTKEFKEDLFQKNLNSISFDDLEKNNIIVLKPHNKILIPSGIKVNFTGEQNKALVAFNKSGVATKLGLDVMACVVDQDYQGEIHISLINNTKKTVKIKEGDKIIQFLMLHIFYESIEEINIGELYSQVSERGEGGFGSTGVK